MPFYQEDAEQLIISYVLRRHTVDSLLSAICALEMLLLMSGGGKRTVAYK